MTTITDPLSFLAGFVGENEAAKKAIALLNERIAAMNTADIRKLALINRGEAVNLARGILQNAQVYKDITPLGVASLAEAVLKMDDALLKINDAVKNGKDR